jgi:hypothetical protein
MITCRGNVDAPIAHMCRYHLIVRTRYFTLRKQRTHPGSLVARTTEFCRVQPNIFSIITAVFFCLHTKLCISSHLLSRMRQIVVRFTGVTPKSWILNTQLASCHPSDT